MKYIPKKTDLNDFTDACIKKVLYKPNRRPREKLLFDAPKFVLHPKTFCDVALAAGPALAPSAWPDDMKGNRRLFTPKALILVNLPQGLHMMEKLLECHFLRLPFHAAYIPAHSRLCSPQ